MKAIADWVDRHHTRSAELYYSFGEWEAVATEAGVTGRGRSRVSQDAAWDKACKDLEFRQLYGRVT